MAKGICPKCDELVGISPTDIALQYDDRAAPVMRLPVGSARYWLVDLHPDKRQEPVDGRYPLCEGCGKKV